MYLLFWLLRDLSYSDLLRAATFFLLHHNIELIFLFDTFGSISTPTVFNVFQIFSDLSLIWDLTTKEIPCLLLRIEIVPLWLFVLFIECSKVSRRVRPIVVICLIAVTSLGMWLVAATFLEVALVALVWPSFLLQRTVRFNLRRFETFWVKTSCFRLFRLGFFHHIIKWVFFLICRLFLFAGSELGLFSI